MNGKHTNLLLVEDNPADAYLLKEMISEKTGKIEVSTVSDGFEALDYMHRRNRYARAPRPDIVLLDLGLPKVSGYDVLKELKANPTLAEVPVIVLTTSSNPDDKLQCAKLGAAKFLSKPHNLGEYEILVDHLTNELAPA